MPRGASSEARRQEGAVPCPADPARGVGNPRQGHPSPAAACAPEQLLGLTSLFCRCHWGQVLSSSWPHHCALCTPPNTCDQLFVRGFG